ncbi:MAG: pantetheine-phosphate adenylyltransferase [Firmicutes bacterium]|nr:pantetheine-phosphate adenylyltransferase [Bacillota bacterium]
MKHKSNLKLGIFPGTFDPFSFGHLDIATRASKLVDELYIAIGINEQKQPLYSVEQRINMINLSTQNLSNIKVVFFDGLLTEYCKLNNINTIFRGLRSIQEFEVEKSLQVVYKSLTKNTIECVYLMCDPKFVHISSTTIKQLQFHNCQLHDYVPKPVLSIINQIGNNNMQ